MRAAPQGADGQSAGRCRQSLDPQARLQARCARLLAVLGWIGNNHIGLDSGVGRKRQTERRHLPASLSFNGRLARLILEFQVLGSNTLPSDPIATSVRP